MRACACVCVCMRVSPLHFVSISQVGNKRFREFEKNGLRTDGRTDGSTDQRMDRPSYRDARTYLKSVYENRAAFDAMLAMRCMPLRHLRHHLHHYGYFISSWIPEEMRLCGGICCSLAKRFERSSFDFESFQLFDTDKSNSLRHKHK